MAEIPKGTYTTDAKGIGEELNTGGFTGEDKLANTLFGTDPRMSVVARDSYTGELVHLDDVRVRYTAGTMLEGVAPTADFKLVVADYEAFRKKETEKMYLTPAPKQQPVQNDAIPTPAKVKDTLGNFGQIPTPICKKFKENVEQAQKNLGMIHNRTDATIFQGDKNGKSPGIMVLQEDNKIYMFDGSAKQYLALDGQKLKIQANGVDTGSSSEQRDFMGFPAYKNPVNDFTPQGTIVSPQPRLLPDIVRLTSIINTIMDLVDMVDVCKEAVEVIKDIRSGSGAGGTIERAKMRKLVSKAEYGTIERATGNATRS